MIAASAPENGPLSLVREIIDAPSCPPPGDGGLSLYVPAIAPAPASAAGPRTGDVGPPRSTFDIIGVEEPMELRWDRVPLRRWRKRRVM